MSYLLKWSNKCDEQLSHSPLTKNFKRRKNFNVLYDNDLYDNVLYDNVIAQYRNRQSLRVCSDGDFFVHHLSVRFFHYFNWLSRWLLSSTVLPVTIKMSQGFAVLFFVPLYYDILPTVLRSCFLRASEGCRLGCDFSTF